MENDSHITYPHEVKCPECDCYFSQWAMAGHLRWTHGYDQQAAEYQKNRVFKHAFEKWRDGLGERIHFKFD